MRGARSDRFLFASRGGAGDGTLAGQILDELADVDVDYEAIDVSPGARSALAIVEGVQVATDLTAGPHVVVANELLDNLPFRRLRGVREIRVGLDGERFVEVETPWDGEPGPADDEMLIPVGAFAFIDRLAPDARTRIRIVVRLRRDRLPGGDIHGYRDHRVVEDVLIDPGSSDITAGVDFASIARHAQERGLIAFPSITQHDALLALGFEGWQREELARQAALLADRDGLEAVRTWSGRSRATLLIDPSALGRLRWLLLASPGLPPPSWLP